MNFIVPSRNSSSTVCMRFVSSGPVFSIFCLPTRPHCGSTVASSLFVDQVCSTLRGPNRRRNSGFFGQSGFSGSSSAFRW